MTLVSNTINSVNPSLDLYTALEAALTSNGYTLVDTVVISTRTHKIWKNPAANNPAAKDYFVDLTYATTGAGALYIMPYEFYDPATDLAYRGPANGVFTPEGTYWSQHGATGLSLENALFQLRAGTTTQFLLDTTIGSSFAFWVSINNRRIAGFTQSTPSKMLYCGLYQPDAQHLAYVGADCFPICVAKLDNSQGGGENQSTADSLAALTRFPRVNISIDQRVTNGPTTRIASVYSSYYLKKGYDMARSNSPSLLYGGGVASPVSVRRESGGSNVMAQEQSFGVMGHLYDIAYAFVDNTVLRGDSVTVGGALWHLTTAVQSLIYSNGSSAGSFLMKD